MDDAHKKYYDNYFDGRVMKDEQMALDFHKEGIANSMKENIRPSLEVKIREEMLAMLLKNKQYRRSARVWSCC